MAQILADADADPSDKQDLLSDCQQTTILPSERSGRRASLHWEAMSKS